MPADEHNPIPSQDRHDANACQQTFSVAWDYCVEFTRGVFEPTNPLLARTLDKTGDQRRRAMVYIDAGLAAANESLASHIAAYFNTWQDSIQLAGPVRVVPGGRQAKTSFKLLTDTIADLANAHLDRHSFVIAIGGGSMLDSIGLAASLVHRGLRMVRLPSTVLAQCDAGVGVKTGLDLHGQKNLIGTFAPPFAVINDLNLLNSLTDADWIAGIAEAFKVAIIKDADFFNSLEYSANNLHARDETAMETLIRKCAAIHLLHICTSGDPFEFGSARPLDFGHWAAHRLEMLSGHAITHGQAVAIGIALDSYYAMRCELISERELARILAAICACGLRVWDELLESRAEDGTLAILAGIEEFREHLGGMINITLPQGIGAKVEVHKMDTHLITEGVSYLKNFSAGVAGK